jgi:hypothetical protein
MPAQDIQDSGVRSRVAGLVEIVIGITKDRPYSVLFPRLCKNSVYSPVDVGGLDGIVFEYQWR